MEKGRDEPSHWHFMRTGRVVVDYHIWRKGYCLVSFQSFTLRYFVIAVIRNTIQTTLQLYSTPSPRLHPLWQIPWIVIILLSTGKTRKMAIGVSVGVVMLIALVTSIVCFVRRRKARALSNQLTTVNARNTSSDTTPLTRANAGNTGMLPQWKREIIQEIPVLLPQEQSLLHPMGHKPHLYPVKQ